MYSETDIIAKAWLVTETVNLVLNKVNLSVDRIYLIGSYASGKQDAWSDLDFLVQLKGGRIYPTWNDIVLIQKKLSRRIHVIFGTRTAQDSLFQKKGDKFTYRELNLQGEAHADSHSPAN